MERAANLGNHHNFGEMGS